MQFSSKTTQLLLLLPPTSHNSHSSKHAILQRLSSRKNEHAMVTNGFKSCDDKEGKRVVNSYPNLVLQSLETLDFEKTHHMQQGILMRDGERVFIDRKGFKE
ncbi:hypothetical protein QL285_022738 [Trifolium repens]|jgi:hypothetical protein|nr:hypothetical protein QL285_022738 [Trifolium repens]